MALVKQTLVAVPTGFKAVGDLQVGDQVFDLDGQITKVSEIGPERVANTVNFVTDSGQTVTASLDHPILLHPFRNSIRASDVGRQPQPAIPVINRGFAESEYWGSERSRRDFLNKSIENSPWKSLEGYYGVLFSDENFGVESPAVIRAIAASGGIARNHRHATKPAVVITEDKAKTHRIKRIYMGSRTEVVPIKTESKSLVITKGLIPVMGDRG